MSAANPQHTEVTPNTTAVWVSTDGCSFAVESTVPARQGTIVYGQPVKVWTRVVLAQAGSSATQSQSAGAAAAVVADVTVNWIGKQTTRLAEASWISFNPKVRDCSPLTVGRAARRLAALYVPSC
jgi:hypothetical protein